MKLQIWGLAIIVQDDIGIHRTDVEVAGKGGGNLHTYHKPLFVYSGVYSLALVPEELVDAHRLKDLIRV